MEKPQETEHTNEKITTSGRAHSEPEQGGTKVGTRKTKARIDNRNQDIIIGHESQGGVSDGLKVGIRD